MDTRKQDFKEGFKLGLPIGIGYFCVSMAFGMMVKNAELPIWMALFMSATNLTSAGQFAGLNLMCMHAGYVEIALTEVMINLRYALMSLSLSQKVKSGMTRLQRALMSFGITDEIFAVSLTRDEISFLFFVGIWFPAFVGWTLGSVTGAAFSSILPHQVADAMNIALYAMFIAILMPQFREDSNKRKAILLSILLSLVFTYVPFLQMNEGWRIIIITLLASAVMAYFYPIQEDVQ